VVSGSLSDTEIRGLLWGAIAFVYPSLYEGFGLPILEAMHAGAPVITSLDPAISEVTAGAAFQVDAAQTAALRQAIVDVLTNEPLRVRLQARGAERANQFSWRSTALLTRAVYVEALRRF
jgi:glycosyltransferase involved in cell wall biosynthesis